ncbi:MAG: hypothetical protein AAF206_23345 [Bacteroidota bacterium]
MKSWLILICSPLLLIACESSHLAKTDFPSGCWAASDTFRFQYDAFSDQTQSLDLGMRFGEEYGYRNIYLKLWMHGPDGTKQEWVLLDTLQDAEGNWLREMNGTSVDWQLQPLTDVQFSSSGSHDFRLIQYMREDNLCELQAVWADVK